MKSQLPGHPDLLISNDQPADKACHKQWEALEIFFGFCVCVCVLCVCVLNAGIDIMKLLC